MAECETCGASVHRRFEHRRRTETMTHRRTRHVCASCHPAMPDSAPLERDESAERIVTDGGRRACPICSGTTIVDGEATTCLDCGWTAGGR